MSGSRPAMMKKGRSTLFIAVAAVVAAFCTAAMAAGFSGNFNGIATAAGMTLNLQEVGGRVVGRLSVPGGRSYALNGERTEKGAQGTLRLGGAAEGVAFFRMEERPLGVQFLFIPAGSDGTARLADARDYSFIAEGVAVPAENRPLAAPGPGEKVDILRFIDEYKLWEPRDVARTYATLDERSLGLVQLYDHASADILWRVCMGNIAGVEMPEKVMHELLDRQQTSCADFVPLAEAARKSELFAEFLRRARFQFEIVRETVLCNRGENTPSKCADVSALGAPLIVHWRDASSIMREIAGVPTPAPSDVATPGTLAPYAPPAPAVAADKPPPASAVAADKPPPTPVVAADKPPLRATIVDTPAGETKAEAFKAFMKAKRLGLKLPLANPRR